jgi:hypothetical protein
MQTVLKNWRDDRFIIGDLNAIFDYWMTSSFTNPPASSMHLWAVAMFEIVSSVAARSWQRAAFNDNGASFPSLQEGVCTDGFDTGSWPALVVTLSNDAIDSERREEDGVEVEDADDIIWGARRARARAIVATTDQVLTPTRIGGMNPFHIKKDC